MSANEPVLLRPTPRYHRVLGRADEIARAMGSPAVGPEHLLLAIIHERDAVPTQALAGLTDLDQLEASVLDAINTTPDPALESEITVRAAGLAVQMGHSHVGVEHLFLAIVRDRDSAAARAMARVVDPARAEAAVLEVMNSPVYRGEQASTGMAAGRGSA